MGLLLVILGLVLWLATGYFILGLVLIIIGLIVMFAGGPGGWYAYPGYRRGPP